MRTILLFLFTVTLASAEMSTRISAHVGRLVQFPAECRLEFDGKGGARIVHWAVPGVAQPTLDQLPTEEQAATWQASQRTLPEQFPNGVAVPIPDQAGHWMLIQPVADGEPIISLQISDSPIDPATWKARKDAAHARYLAAKAALKAEQDALKVQIADLKGKLDTATTDIAAAKTKLDTTIADVTVLKTKAKP